MLSTYLAPLVCIAGALAHGLLSNSKAAELGRIMFAMGLLATLMLVGGHAIKLL